MDYEKLYHDLFNAVTDSIENLKEAQLKAEENYIKMTEDENKNKNKVLKIDKLSF